MKFTITNILPYLTHSGRWGPGRTWDLWDKAGQDLAAWERRPCRCDARSRTGQAGQAHSPNIRCIRSHVSRTCGRTP